MLSRYLIRTTNARRKRAVLPRSGGSWTIQRGPVAPPRDVLPGEALLIQPLLTPTQATPRLASIQRCCHWAISSASQAMDLGPM